MIKSSLVVDQYSTMNIPADTQTSPTHVEVEPPFETFFQGWLTRQAQFLQQLRTQLSLIEVGEVQQGELGGIIELIGKVLAHYNEYFEAKSRIIRRNVFLLFSPPWFTPYEQMFLWIAGFKPGLVFRIVSGSGLRLTEEQARQMEVLVAETAEKERQLTEQLVRVQQEVAAPPMVALARMAGREVNGMVDDVERAIDTLITGLEAVVAGADYLRGKTVLKVIEILDAGQTVRFLAAAGQLQLSVRGLGMTRDATSGNVTSL